MTKGTKTLIAVAVLLAVALVSGLTGMALNNYGSQNDPLVTLSYLNETLTPAIREEVERAVNEKIQALTEEFNRVAAQGGGTGTPGTSAPSGFTVLTLSKGQTVTCAVGAEIMLRIGSAQSAGPDSPRLVDETDGSTVAAAGTALTPNHLYMVTIKNNGVKATADNTKILISGEYTVS